MIDSSTLSAPNTMNPASGENDYTDAAEKLRTGGDEKKKSNKKQSRSSICSASSNSSSSSASNQSSSAFLTNSKYQVSLPNAITDLATAVEPVGLPSDFKVSPYDVVCGRGKGSYNRPGNKTFRAIVSTHVDEYLKAKNKLDKSMVLSTIVEEVREQNNGTTRFVKRRRDGTWYEIGDEHAREKVGHAIREAISARQQQEQRKGKQTTATKTTVSQVAPPPPQSSSSSPPPSLSVPLSSSGVGNLMSAPTSLSASTLSPAGFATMTAATSSSSSCSSTGSLLPSLARSSNSNDSIAAATTTGLAQQQRSTLMQNLLEAKLLLLQQQRLHLHLQQQERLLQQQQLESSLLASSRSGSLGLGTATTEADLWGALFSRRSS